MITLRPSIQPRERLLTFGVGGTGKSNAYLEMAKKMPDVTFHAIDTDAGNWERILAYNPDVTNVEVHNTWEWAELTSNMQKCNKVMAPDDWLTIDIATASWDMVQEYFAEQIFGQDIDKYFIEQRLELERLKKDNKALGAFEGWKDWPVINKIYFKGFYGNLLRCPGHVYLTAEQAKIESEDDKETKQLYGSFLYKPKGQKRLGHVPHTVLHLTKKRQGEWYMSTVKDRERVEMEEWPVNNFAVDYLMKVAGWKVAKV